MAKLWHKLTAPKTRTWLYGIAVAALPLLVLVSSGGPAELLDDGSTDLWITLFGAVLVPGVAFANRPTKTRRSETSDPVSRGTLAVSPVLRYSDNRTLSPKQRRGRDNG